MALIFLVMDDRELCPIENMTLTYLVMDVSEVCAIGNMTIMYLEDLITRPYTWLLQ